MTGSAEDIDENGSEMSKIVGTMASFGSTQNSFGQVKVVWKNRRDEANEGKKRVPSQRCVSAVNGSGAAPPCMSHPGIPARDTRGLVCHARVCREA